VYSFFLSGLWAAAAAGLAWYCAGVTRQITYVTLADGRKQERRLPFLFRLLLPFAPNFRPLLRNPAFAGARERIRARLAAAGFDDLLTDEDYLALGLLLPLVLGPVWIALLHVALSAGAPPVLSRAARPLYAAVPLLLGVYPSLWLRSALAARHRRIQRSLPFVLDLLTLSVEAGMDFMMAMQRNVERLGADPLGEELIRAIREIQLGKTRREALRSMSARVGLPDLRSVVNALVQADELGVSIGSILRIQAEQIRQRRFERAEKLANEAPVKMLFPLMFFIFPAVFLILLGPILARVVRQLLL